MSNARPLIVCITGASGAVYAARLLDVLLSAGREVHLSISPAGGAVIRQELGVEVELEAARFRVEALLAAASNDAGKGGGPAPPKLHYHHYMNLMAPIASGSFLSSGMVVCPCSGSSLSAIAHSASGNLIHRAAEVQLKERRPLVLVPRETPLSLPQIDNMRRAAEAGAIVLPASPGWYHGVRGVADLVDFVVARICDHLGVDNDLMKRWGE